MSSSITVYIDIDNIADEIRSNDAFIELINALAESKYDYIGQSDDELTDEGKNFIKKLAKQIEEMETET